MAYGAVMVEALRRSVAPVDPTVFGDPAAVEEIHRTILSEAPTLDDLAPLEGEIDFAAIPLT
jgi:hypothetical protein